jgi:NAD(P)H-hydrate epimerase
MVEEFGINLFQMMENAGRSLALLAKTKYLSRLENPCIVVLAGTGGNGGGGLVASRNLLNWGYKVIILTSKNIEDYHGVPKQQFETLITMDADIIPFDNFNKSINCNLIIDALLGYSISGNPRGIVKEMIQWANHTKLSQDMPILSLDLPSGIGPEGEVFTPVIRADTTLTLALPKQSMYKNNTRNYIGELFLADIGVPPKLYESRSFQFDLKTLFKDGNILKIY